MCHSFRRGTMQMYQIREANSGGNPECDHDHDDRSLYRDG